MILRKRITMYIDVECDVPEKYLEKIPSNEESFESFAHAVKEELETNSQKVDITGFMEDIV